MKDLKIFIGMILLTIAITLISAVDTLSTLMSVIAIIGAVVCGGFGVHLIDKNSTQEEID